MNNMNFPNKIISLMATAMLSACGGIDEMLLTPTEEATPVPAVAPTTVPIVTPAPVTTITPTPTPAPTVAINLALNKEASQSSLAYGGEAIYAIDGNTDGTFQNSSVTHTEVEPQA